MASVDPSGGLGFHRYSNLESDNSGNIQGLDLPKHCLIAVNKGDLDLTLHLLLTTEGSSCHGNSESPCQKQWWSLFIEFTAKSY